jgi:hypothetical protein
MRHRLKRETSRSAITPPLKRNRRSGRAMRGVRQRGPAESLVQSDLYYLLAYGERKQAIRSPSAREGGERPSCRGSPCRAEGRQHPSAILHLTAATPSLGQIVSLLHWYG